MIRLFISTPVFDSLWKAAGLSDEDMRLLETDLMKNPATGRVIQGACSLRKVRFRIPGQGKSGGIRVFYVDFPKYSELFLLYLIRKNEKENISAKDKKLICNIIKEIEANLEKKYKYEKQKNKDIRRNI